MSQYNMHVGIANPQWREDFRHSRRMRNPHLTYLVRLPWVPSNNRSCILFISSLLMCTCNSVLHRISLQKPTMKIKTTYIQSCLSGLLFNIKRLILMRTSIVGRLQKYKIYFACQSLVKSISSLHIDPKYRVKWTPQIHTCGHSVIFFKQVLLKLLSTGTPFS